MDTVHQDAVANQNNGKSGKVCFIIGCIIMAVIVLPLHICVIMWDAWIISGPSSAENPWWALMAFIFACSLFVILECGGGCSVGAVVLLILGRSYQRKASTVLLIIVVLITVAADLLNLITMFHVILPSEQSAAAIPGIAAYL